MTSRDTEKLKSDLKAVIEDAEVLMKNVAAPAGDSFRSAKDRLETTLRNAKDEVIRIEKKVVDKTKQAALKTDHYVKDHPWQAVGFGTAVGLVIGMLIRRK